MGRVLLALKRLRLPLGFNLVDASTVIGLLVIATWVAGLVYPRSYETTAPAWMGAFFVVWYYGLRARRVRRRERERFEELADRLPQEVHHLSIDEERGIRVLAVTLNSGEMKTVEMPIEYDARKDGGIGLMRAILGEDDPALPEIETVWREYFA